MTGASNRTNLIRSSLKIMVRLRDRFSLSVSLGTFDASVPDGEVIEHVTGRSTHAMVLQKGLRLILHAGAPGKAYLANLPSEELDDVLDRLELTRFTKNTITTREGLLRELSSVRRKGYAVDNSEYVDYTACVGAAILDSRQYPIAAIWIHGMVQSMNEKGIDALGQHAAEAAGQIAVNMQKNQYQNQAEYADFVIQAVCKHVADDLSSRIDVRALAGQYHVSYSTLGHWFKERLGCGPNQYHLQMRLEAAMRMLKDSQATVKDIASRTGFPDHMHFHKLFKKKYGRPPLDFRD